MTQNLLVVAHVPSPNTKRLFDAVLAGAGESNGVTIVGKSPFRAGPDELMAADGIILGTTENLGYMSGAMKDFFDRIYYPCLEETQGRPYCLYIRAGHDGTGTRRGIETIVKGLRWRSVQEPIILRGDWQDDFLNQCRELGAAMAAGLEAGIF